MGGPRWLLTLLALIYVAALALLLSALAGAVTQWVRLR